MNEQTRQELKNFQQKMRDKTEEELRYSNNGVYGMMIMLDSILNEDLTTEEALNEFIHNTDLKVTEK